MAIQPHPKREAMFKTLRPLLPSALRNAGNRFLGLFLKARERARLERRLSRATPIIIYQMGKVGSTSIYHSLSKLYPGVVLHAHDFSSQHEDWRVRRLYRWARAGERSLNLISLIREPIGRNVSAFFENFLRDTGIPYEQANFSLDELRRIFLANYRHEIPLDWFDKHIRRNFGIDVYATPFPECGYATYAQGKVRLLVLRSEVNDRQKTEVIKEFLGLPEFEIFNRNVGEDKLYAETYRQFKEKVKLPRDYVTKLCESRYFTHFYSRDVIDQMRRRWSEPEEAPSAPLSGGETVEAKERGADQDRRSLKDEKGGPPSS